jgi:nicotinamidase/pyrazinamidase
MSDVPNFGHFADPIFEDAAKSGMKFAKASQVFKEN